MQAGVHSRPWGIAWSVNFDGWLGKSKEDAQGKFAVSGAPFEIRSPKPEIRMNDENQKHELGNRGRFRVWGFGHSFGFLVSDFGFPPPLQFQLVPAFFAFPPGV